MVAVNNAIMIVMVAVANAIQLLCSCVVCLVCKHTC